MDLQPLILPVPEAAAAAPRWLALTSAAQLHEVLGMDGKGVDFARNVLLVAFRGRCRSSGHSVRLVGAEQQDDVVEVQVQLTDPPAGAITLTALTYPRALALLPKSALSRRGRLSFRFRDGHGRELATVQAEVD